MDKSICNTSHQKKTHFEKNIDTFPNWDDVFSAFLRQRGRNPNQINRKSFKTEVFSSFAQGSTALLQ